MDDFVAPRETFEEATKLALLLAQDPFESAVGVARHLGTHEPLRVPSRPASRFTDRELDGMAAHGDKLEGSERRALERWHEWRMERAHALDENAKRLRGILWALDTLATKPEDERVPTMAGLLIDFLNEVWGWRGKVPEGYADREAAVLRSLSEWRRQQ